MVNELCELASSGISTKSVILAGAALVLFGVIGYILHRKNKLNAKWLMPVIVLLFTVFSPISSKVLAQSAPGCTPNQGGSQNPGGVVRTNGQLIDDNPSLAGVFDYFQPYPYPFIAYSAIYTIVNNDTAPGGDPFDFATLRLLDSGNSVMDEGREKFLILDPNDQTLPLNPDALWEYDYDAQYDTNTNVWGWWALELTCNESDIANCDSPGPLDDDPICTNPGGGTCWPSGKIRVSLKNTAPSGVYSIPYTVDTVGGLPSNTATVTIEVPDTQPDPPLIYAQNFNVAICFDWEPFPIDIMSYITYNGSGTLLPETIDLIPDTPELDRSVTINDPSGEVFIFTVDNNGLLTVDNIGNSFSWGFGWSGVFHYTIMDSNGIISNTGTVLRADCD
jgi:hypothetical protein